MKKKIKNRQAESGDSRAAGAPPPSVRMAAGASVCTFGRDGEHGVGGGGAVDVGRVPHTAGEGAIVGQRGVEQRDGRLAARRAALPPDAALELAVRRGEGLRREVEELEERRRTTTPRETAA